MTGEPRLLRSYGDTDFITGLRAIAATMVVMIHTAALADFGTIGQAITAAGKYGVDIFLVISGFTVAKTFSEARNYRAYLTRRVMRILPLYWLTVSIAMMMWLSGAFALPNWMQELGARPDAYNYVMHLTMLSFLDYRVANSVIGVEWSIPVEVFWYVCLPPIIHFGRTIPRAIMAALFLISMAAGLAYLSKAMFGTSQPVSWSPFAYGHLFIIGVAAYYLRARLAPDTSRRLGGWIAGAAILFTVALAVQIGGRDAVLALCTATLIACVTPARARWITAPLTARPMLFLGSISYSLYLIHMLVIHVLDNLAILPGTPLAQFALVYVVTISLSTLTYLAIEKPTNRIGRRLAEGTWSGLGTSPLRGQGFAAKLASVRK